MSGNPNNFTNGISSTNQPMNYDHSYANGSNYLTPNHPNYPVLSNHHHHHHHHQPVSSSIVSHDPWNGTMHVNNFMKRPVPNGNGMVGPGINNHHHHHQYPFINSYPPASATTSSQPAYGTTIGNQLPHMHAHNVYSTYNSLAGVGPSSNFPNQAAASSSSCSNGFTNPINPHTNHGGGQNVNPIVSTTATSVTSSLPATSVTSSLPATSQATRRASKRSIKPEDTSQAKPRGRPRKRVHVEETDTSPEASSKKAVKFGNGYTIVPRAPATSTVQSLNTTLVNVPLLMPAMQVPMPAMHAPMPMPSMPPPMLVPMPAMPASMPSASTSSNPADIPSIVSTNVPTVTAQIPTPPNWLDHCEDTTMSLFTFKKYQIDPESLEYQTIANMLDPVQVLGIEQIVNPDLWKRFVNTRKDMFTSKSDNLKILSKLGLDEKDVLRCAHLAMNYNADPLLTPYSDNMVLLYHCTRNQVSLNSILTQGLDERLSNISGGLLGKGIYFADDPNKALQYDGTGSIFIFAVLLGDCISVDNFHNKSHLVREPEKVKDQKRNHNDIFFDSIVARPAGFNEYVIYNRYQCCPIYQVKYQRYSRSQTQMQPSKFNCASYKLPPLAWVPTMSSYAMPIQKNVNWPFFAVDIFEAMGVPRPTDDDSNNEIGQNEITDSGNQHSVDFKLAQLLNLGFTDENKNRETLATFNNDIHETVNYLLDETVTDGDATDTSLASTSMQSSNASTSQIVPPTSDNLVPSATADQSIEIIDLVDDDVILCSDDEEETVSDDVARKTEPVAALPEDIAEWALDFHDKNSIQKKEDCPICCSEFDSYDRSPSSWQVLQCTHKLCVKCYKTMLTTRSTMSGVEHTFIKCPFCQGISGTEIGTCPDMHMNVSIQSNSCESYESTSTLCIHYMSSSFKRTAYLPNNADGNEILGLLRIAFDRRLCFSVGTSATTGRENVIVWNIHHKTSQSGGVSHYGYPDPGYIDRVKWELKSFGIE